MRIEIPEKKKLVHTMEIPIRWGDMDTMGHVNNAVYFTYLETTRIAWMQSLGIPPNPQGQGPIIINAFCNFHRQLEYPGTALVRMYVSNPGRSSFDSWATIERTEMPGVIHATGGATTVWVEFPNPKSVPLPQWLRQLLGDESNSPVP